MKTILLCLTGLLACTTATLAEVVPWMVATGRGVGVGNIEGVPSFWEVPAGKIFIVDRVQHDPGNGGNIDDGDRFAVQFSQKPANFAFRRTFYVNFGAYERFRVYWFDRPITLAAGDRCGSNQSSGYTFFWGKLVDAGDLFAKLDVNLEDSQVVGGELKALAKVSPARPHRLTVESATQLSNFSPDPSLTITPTDKSAEKRPATRNSSVRWQSPAPVGKPNSRGRQ